MFGAILSGSMWRKKRRQFLVLLSISSGAAVCAGLAGVGVGVGDKVQGELRSYGANIEVLPADQALPLAIRGIDYRPLNASGRHYLQASQLPALKRMFWRNNVLAFAPFLSAPAQIEGHRTELVGTWFDHPVPVPSGLKPFRTGLLKLEPTWQITGQTPADAAFDAARSDFSSQGLIGTNLAARLGLKPGGTVNLSCGGHAVRLDICGVLRTGGDEDDQIVVPLGFVQAVTQRPDDVERIQLSALTTPENQGPAAKDPAHDLSPEALEKWSCTSYPSSIAHAIDQAMPGAVATPIRRVAHTEGQILTQVSWLMTLVSLAALVASILGVMSAMTTVVLQRRAEIALLKALGAEDATLLAVFLAEGSVLALGGGLLGYAGGWLLARQVGLTLFGDPLSPPLVVLPLTLLVSLGVVLLGSAWPLRKALRLDPKEVLHG